jgi:hypothetical protein
VTTMKNQLPLFLIGGVAVLLDAFVLLVFGGQVDLITFLAFTTIVAGAGCAGVLKPREVGHLLAVILGATAIAGAVGAFYRGMTPVLPITLLVTGALMGYLALRSWRGERVAWSFLVAIMGVLFICMFFGAPKVRGAIGVGIWVALIVPGLFLTGMMSLASQSARYNTTR